MPHSRDAHSKTPFFIIWILGALNTITPFSIDMYLPAFQKMAVSFQTTVPKISLSLSSYFIGLAIGQLFYGPFLDRFGRKPPLFFGLGLYLLASVACLVSPNVEILIVSRFIQALGGCSASVASVAMIRDFYPPAESAKVFSRLMLILSVSPLFAPTIGSWITVMWGWEAVFIVLMLITSLLLVVIYFTLPEGHAPDRTVSLKVGAIAKEFQAILKARSFITYSLSGAFSFGGLFLYLAAAPSLFMSDYQLSEKSFGSVFAFLSVGLIGAGQMNVALLKRWSGERIFRTALTLQALIALVFCVGAVLGWYGLYGHVAVFFLFFACVGLTYPNAAALALAPFEKNAGSAAAMLGFLQMGTGALVSACFSFLPFSASVAVSSMFLVTVCVGLLILKWGRRVRG